MTRTTIWPVLTRARVALTSVAILALLAPLLSYALSDGFAPWSERYVVPSTFGLVVAGALLGLVSLAQRPVALLGLIGLATGVGELALGTGRVAGQPVFWAAPLAVLVALGLGLVMAFRHQLSVPAALLAAVLTYAAFVAAWWGATIARIGLFPGG